LALGDYKDPRVTDLDVRKLLVPFLFTVMAGERATWYGVSGYSLEDALSVLRAAGFEIDVGDPAVSVREHPRLTDFEARHIGPNMGPMQFRGVWFPRMNV
jgi:hypothetical protein